MKSAEQRQRHRFWVLVIIVSISGFSQGMLLPLISSIFENDGISGTLNGLNATGLYIGTLLVSPFMEAPLRRFGYKPVIIAGGLIVIISLLSFPLWKSVVFWFFLRLMIGIGDHALHFATQTWVTSTVPPERLGRSISIYGLSVGVGFAVGPMFVPLVTIFEGLPFIVSACLTLIAWGLVFTLRNDMPEVMAGTASEGRFVKRVKATVAVAGIAMLGPMAYGFLESSLNAMFPVYALRNGIPLTMVSVIIPAFAFGGILSQVPLGILSDRIGRRPVLLIAMGGGVIAFTCAAVFSFSAAAIMAAFFAGGVFCGSLFSLGVAYMSDLTPKSLLPTGNLLCGIFFSIGSLTGPILGGYVLETFQASYLYLFSAMLGILFLLTWLGKKQPQQTV
ncbi:putative MFS-type transporter YfkF [Sporosarcina sp. NCCP-2716]|uniref:MFS transporter n=1 Tax=Sporosarcina sp. NCCP-2716 TaxID=2943679 RepID=UPI00203D8D61|nr:MFS transporter [Sporosarcina sp. NCCP-2716]GKV69641.1 putative MFS-type transporter YfkF [Sporosarcina sp. NCCP-2716]